MKTVIKTYVFNSGGTALKNQQYFEIRRNQLSLNDGKLSSLLILSQDSTYTDVVSTYSYVKTRQANDSGVAYEFFFTLSD